MRELLYDLHKTDGVVYVMGCNYNRDDELNKYYLYTLEKHGVTQSQFDSSLVWYTDNPKRFNKIYPPVIKRLQEEYDSFAWLDTKKNKKRVKPSDIPPYNLDSLYEVNRNGLKNNLHIAAFDSLQRDTTLYYIFPQETIDSLSLVTTHYSDSVKSSGSHS